MPMHSIWNTEDLANPPSEDLCAQFGIKHHSTFGHVTVVVATQREVDRLVKSGQGFMSTHIPDHETTPSLHTLWNTRDIRFPPSVDLCEHFGMKDVVRGSQATHVHAIPAAISAFREAFPNFMATANPR